MRNGRGRNNKEADVNLLPMIDILAVCITFLLTAVVVKIGSFELNQALGTSTLQDEQKDKPTLWVEFQPSNSAKFEVRIGTRVTARTSSKDPVRDIAKIASMYKGQNPDLKTAMVLPASNSRYQDLIKVMDGLKKNEITEIGIAPL
jgi:biopolymer transport protein ExbD